MKLSALDYLFWALGFAATSVVLVVLVWRARWRQFPLFTLWLAFEAILTIVLFAIYLLGSTSWYSHVYWDSCLPAFALQLGVIFEIARVVLRPTGTWVRDARGLFVTTGVGGAAIAAVLTWWITPPRWGYPAWELRGDLFTSLVICELFVAMTFTANRLGLGWRSHVMALGQGLIAWAGASMVTNALESYFGTVHFSKLEYLQSVAWVGAMAWIAVRFWDTEPERRPISEDLQKYILALHQRVEYDLRRFGAGN